MKESKSSVNMENRENREIHLVILDSHTEIKVIQKLASSEFDIAGRHLAIEDIDPQQRINSILIASSDVLTMESAGQMSKIFGGVVNIGNKPFPGCYTVSEFELDRLTQVIEDLISDEVVVAEELKDSIFKGLLPRVGASSIENLFTSYSGGDLFLFNKRGSTDFPRVLCCEIDDISILKLFTFLDDFVGNPHKTAVIFNKVGRSPSSQNRVRALVKELQTVGISQVFAIPFDEQLPISGKFGRKSRRKLRPLFDWILEEN